MQLRQPEPLRVLDQCRTTPGIVQEVDGDTAVVVARPLLWDAGRLLLGAPEPRATRWRDDGRAFVPPPMPGQSVSLHWDFVCDVLTPGAGARLAGVTRRVLAAVNADAGAPLAQSR